MSSEGPVDPEINDEPTAISRGESYKSNKQSHSKTVRSKEKDAFASNVKAIKALGIKVKANPYDYEAHVSYITTLKDHVDKGNGVANVELLRHARDQMRSVFPLNEMLWRDWINDEKALERSSGNTGDNTTSGSHTDRIGDLYKLAFQDYLSVPLLLEYCQYMSARVNMTCTSVGRRVSSDKNDDDASDDDNTHDKMNETAIEHAREAYERALAQGGLHLSEGIQIWKSYIDFETAVCDMIEELYDDNDEMSVNLDGKPLKQQQNRIANLYKRAVSIPLRGLKTIRSMEIEWADENETEADIEATKTIYTQSLEKLGVLEVLEEALERTLAAEKGTATVVSAECGTSVSRCAGVGESERAYTNESSVSLYQRYVKHEIENGDDPSRVTVLFERAVATHALSMELWIEYVSYMEARLPTSTLTLTVCERATRNCPWVSYLWQIYLRVLERKGAPYHELEGVFHKALGAGFSTSDDYLQLWLCFIDYERRLVDWEEVRAMNMGVSGTQNEGEGVRKSTTVSAGVNERSTIVDQMCGRLRECFQKAIEYMRSCFGKPVGDPYASLTTYWARVELHLIGDVQRSRALWEGIVKDYPKQSGLWIEFAKTEVLMGEYGAGMHGSKDECMGRVRKIYKSGIQKTSGDYALCQAFVQFERENGTMDTYDTATKRVKSCLEAARVRQEKINEKEIKKERTKVDEENAKATVSNSRKQAKSAKQTATEKAETVHSQPTLELDTRSNSKRQHENATVNKSESTEDAKRAMKRAKVGDEEDSKHTLPKTTSTTVFLSNLSYQANEDDVKRLFEDNDDKKGAVKEVRLVRQPNGQSKGYGYLEFTNLKSAAEALLLDRKFTLHGRLVFVSVMNAPKLTTVIDPVAVHGPGGSVGDGERAPRTVFCKGLPADSTVLSIQTLFEPYGEVTSCRPGKGRDGKFKGFAFIEFSDESQAQVALALNDTFAGESKLRVLISSDKGDKANPSQSLPSIHSDEILTSSSCENANANSAVNLKKGVKLAGRLVPRMVKRAGPHKTPVARIHAVTRTRAEHINGTKTFTSASRPSVDSTAVDDISMHKLSNADFKDLLMKGK
eukprot:CFRG4485T1